MSVEAGIIESEWIKYKKMVYPEGMTPDQENQLHQAWFASSSAAILSVIDTISNQGEAKARETINGMVVECEAFCSELLFQDQQRN